MTPNTLSRAPQFRTILAFWLPLASTWLMMAVEGPYLAAVIARLAAPTANLAAFGVAFAVAILIEAPVIMLMSASTAMVEDRPSYLAWRRFAYVLIALLTGAQAVLLIPTVFDFFVRTLLGLPEEVARLTYGSLVLLLPWSAAIGYRRFRQGLLIRASLTRRVAYGTVLRVVAMSCTALVGVWLTRWPGAYIGALALSVGVAAEAVASRAMTARVVAEVMGRGRAQHRMARLRLPAVLEFYTPLALTSVLSLAVHPMVTFFMGLGRYPLESLAVFPVVHGLTFIFRALGLSYLEVVIALVGDRYEHLRTVRNFAVILAAVATAGLSAIAFTPLLQVWFRDVSGLTAELTRFALTPVQILCVFPALSVTQAVLRGLLVRAQRTRAVIWATMIEVSTVALMLMIGLFILDLVGVTAAALAILVGRAIGALGLVPACLAAIGSVRLPPERVAAALESRLAPAEGSSDG